MSGMNHKFTVVETSLNRAEFRWKWLRFLEHSFALGSLICLLALIFGGAMLLGLVSSKTWATAFFALLAMAGFIAWAIVIISIAAGAPDRSWLAAALERADGRLLDRLNTLLFLERDRGDAQAQAFAMRIAKQTQGLVGEKALPSPFPGRRPLKHGVAFGLALGATILLYVRYSPWDSVAAAEQAKSGPPVSPDKPLELALPANNVEQELAWGEVRITDPGTDLKLTKVDVVPMQIEVAANQALKSAAWFSAINGAHEAAHELPPPSEPRYAVYQPTLYLDELRLSDWDVMTYYAKANTEKENAFASELYFVEVRPFREDILKLPGGERGKVYEYLSEMSALIDRQQQVIRQTHQYSQKTTEPENLQAQDRTKLSEAEGDLSDSTKHLYAKMAGEMENQPIGEALDNLAKAEGSLGEASKLLQNNMLNEAPNREREALAQLVAARKTFQKAVSDHPQAFEGADEKDAAPLADSSKKLNEIAEFRNETRAAQQFVQRTVEQQKSLEQQARVSARSGYSKLAEQERQLEESLEQFQAEHPQAFKGSQDAADQARQAMGKAGEALEKRASDAAGATRQATQELEKLSQTMNRQTAGQQLADAYRLKQMLDKEIQTFDQRTKAGSKVSDRELDGTASEARSTIDQLKKSAEQEPTRDLLGQPLRDSLNGQNKVELDAKLTQVQQAQDEAARQKLAGEARDALSKVSRAFAASEPKPLQMAQKADSLKTGEQDSFSQGMSELESLVKQLENHRQVAPEDQAKQAQQALANLQSGVRSQYGDNELANQVVLRLQEALKAEAPDVGDLKKLMDQLQRFSVESADRLAKKEDKPEVTNIDPTRLPPAYRGRIQKYFEKLSEK